LRKRLGTQDNQLVVSISNNTGSKQYTYTMQTQAEHQHSWSSGLDSLAVCMRFMVRIRELCTFCQNVLYAHFAAHILAYTVIGRQTIIYLLIPLEEQYKKTPLHL
jgi:hypothetical protein